MKFAEYKNPDYAALAEQIRQYWKEKNIFEKSIADKSKPSFTFYEGPPSANGTPGIHHVMARAIKDIFCRFKTMKGFNVQRKAGWDTHGLPVELQVEKELGITKDDIGKKISVADYNQKCRETVMKFTDQWNDLTERIGFWLDLDNPYVTYENNYIESIWHLLKLMHEKGYLYKGYTIQPYSPAAGTGLSSHELNLPGCYKMVKDTSVVAQFKIKNTEKDYFLAWTTTPWTLPSNSALAVGANIVYVKVATRNPYTAAYINVILAKDLIPNFFDAKGLNQDLDAYKPGDKILPFKVLEGVKGIELAGIEYEQLMPYVQPDRSAFRVILGDFVSTEDGTGIVHIAPTFGADDFRVAQQNNIPAILVTDADGEPMPLVDKHGRFVPEVTDYAGKYVKNYDDQNEADPEYKPTDLLIALKLKMENKAFRIEKYEHNYPHCWRTDKPVLYYPLSSWFIKTTAIKDRLVELNKTINWKPASTGSGRFGNWLENLVDWNLSRSRYWGTPLPIWRSEDGKVEKCIGSVAELTAELEKANKSKLLSAEEKADNKIYLEQLRSGNYDLHRPYIDSATLVDGNAKLKREADLIDVWFDSGAMPYAQWHYPFENQEVFAKNFPADFIAEGVDQTRGWFFTLHVIGTMLFDSVAFKNVIANGLVLDKNGLKMSKRLGNAVNPFETVAKYGPDATRWYMVVNAPPWDNLKFNTEGVAEVQRKFFGTLFNTYSFFSLYANLDGFSFAEPEIPVKNREYSDRWILSKLNSLVETVEKGYSDYDATPAGRAIQDFVNEDLSNWYVRLNRKRFWKSAYNADKIAAYQTLYQCLETVARLMAPIAPFYADKLFNDLNQASGLDKAESVHLADFPKHRPDWANLDIEAEMELAQKVSSLVHSIRKKQNIRVRQPLEKVLVPVLNARTGEQLNAVADIIMSEVNVKSVETITDTAGLVTKKAKPNFKVLGKALGAKMKSFSVAVAGLTQEQITDFERKMPVVLDLEGDPYTLGPDDLEILSEDIPGWAVASDAGLTVALDLTITDDLLGEGIARDLVNRVQNIRKDQDFDVLDKIRLTVELGSHPLMEAAITQNKAYIETETQAIEVTLSAKIASPTEVEMEGFMLNIAVEKVV